jgi:ATP-dependent exoDNAse (exonuclease V) beta subunit
MNSVQAKPLPPDQLQRQQALDPARSILVQAPAGSGKTDLLTRRFLRLLAKVDEPRQVVAITFTNAAAAEMRHRILAELEKAAATQAPLAATSAFAMDTLARRVLERSQALGWNLFDLSAQLRISTIDSFCRELALQQPLLSGVGGGLNIAEQPDELYHQAARQAMLRIDEPNAELSAAIEALLLWRDNNWQEMEDLLVQMLGQRDRWMHDFVLSRDPDWEALRERLERPFANAVREALTTLDQLFSQVPGSSEEALQLARFACEQTGGKLHSELAELADFPTGPFSSSDVLEEARQAYLSLVQLLLTGEGAFRRQVNVRLGFPADRKREKTQLLDLIARLKAVPSLESALAVVSDLPPARYTDDDWRIVRACFTLLRHAAAELQVVFAEAGTVDFIEVAQIAQRVLRGPDGMPTDAALDIADGIHHLLVDEFQDTSRRQHQLLASLIAAWPERTGRTCFAVGDPMQSIYFFRDADAELFPRVKTIGLEIPYAEPLLFDFIPLTANFRTAPSLVHRLNEVFEKIFATNDGSGVTFSSAEPARASDAVSDPRFTLHLKFVPQNRQSKAVDPGAVRETEAARAAQAQEIVALIQSHMGRIEQARASGEKYRIAVLGRTRNALAPVAEALREAKIPFRALDLEKLSARPEVLDALALARALLNPQDRVAWLGVLRAPWCGLALDDLHCLTSADDADLLARPVPDLLAERLPLPGLEISQAGRRAAVRVLETLGSVPELRANRPTASLGTWLEEVWLRLGGAACVDATARANLDLLWSCLDRFPAGEQNLLGPALSATLDKLTALPDPAADSACGVQLMTIHKSKGLEFEVVIVPDLQAPCGRGSRKLLSWLERGLNPEIESGLTPPDNYGEITEFLIAPLQPKGADRGKAKAWVDRVYARRESQEERRILYVASTRAREELHLFARPACKVESDSALSLPAPTANLLATAWPAFEEEVRSRFEDWKATVTPAETAIESIAASGESNLLIMPSPAKPTLLRRLPSGYRSPQAEDLAPALAGSSVVGMGAFSLYARHEGGQISRALGTAVHMLLEELARLRKTTAWDAARTALQRLEPRIAAQIRASGVEQAQAAQIAAQAFQLAFSASHDPIAQWILSPHAAADSEVRWAGVVAGNLHTVRVDRVFQAGPAPGSEGEECWWIIDYKTTHADNLDPATALLQLRPIFAPQLETYAEVLRNLHGKDTTLRAGLYYPRMLLLDCWEI